MLLVFLLFFYPFFFVVVGWFTSFHLFVELTVFFFSFFFFLRVSLCGVDPLVLKLECLPDGSVIPETQHTSALSHSLVFVLFLFFFLFFFFVVSTNGIHRLIPARGLHTRLKEGKKNDSICASERIPKYYLRGEGSKLAFFFFLVRVPCEKEGEKYHHNPENRGFCVIFFLF